MDDRELIEKIRARNRSPYPPVSPAHLHKAEMHLGFSLPPFLKTLYLEVANGGFGPHNGISGLDGEDGRPWGIPDDVPGEFQATEQIGTWFTICDWGCCNWSVIDCSNPERDEMIFIADNGKDTRQGIGFRQWMEDWVNGVDLWERCLGQSLD